MKRVRPEEIGVTDLGTLMQGPEYVYVAIAIQPPSDTQLITVHRSLQAAQRHVEGYEPQVQAHIEKLPLLP